MDRTKKAAPISFRPVAEVAQRVEMMQQLRVNQSEVFNAILAANIKTIDAAIAKRRQQLQALLGMPAR